MLQVSPFITVDHTEQSVREVIGKHGIRRVFYAFQKIMKEDYDFLAEYFQDKKSPEVLPPVPVPTPSVKKEKETKSETEEGNEEPKVHKLAKAIIKVKKVDKHEEKEKEREIPITPETVASQGEEVKDIRIHQFLEGEQPIQADPSSAPGIPPMPPKGLSVKEIKQWQKTEEDRKRDELKSQGIDPQSLLTKDNLKLWIEKENKSYAVVARYHVGLPEMYVSEVAKKFGVQSALAKKRRAQIMAARGGR
jgi:hypothetical protein